MEKVAVFLASGGLLSHCIYNRTKNLPKFFRGCGIVGTAWAFLFWWVFPLGPMFPRLLLLLVMSLLSVKIAHMAEGFYGNEDDSRIVIDEFVGYSWAVIALPKTMPIFLISAFLFRVLDVWKPFGIHRLEEIPNGWGCVLDDVASGLVAAFIVFVGLRIFC